MVVDEDDGERASIGLIRENGAIMIMLGCRGVCAFARPGPTSLSNKSRAGWVYILLVAQHCLGLFLSKLFYNPGSPNFRRELGRVRIHFLVHLLPPAPHLPLAKKGIGQGHLLVEAQCSAVRLLGRRKRNTGGTGINLTWSFFRL